MGRTRRKETASTFYSPASITACSYWCVSYLFQFRTSRSILITVYIQKETDAMLGAFPDDEDGVTFTLPGVGKVK
jgi:hypothetical protein